MANNHQWIGAMPVEAIACQIATTARLRHQCAADLTTLSNEEWNELAGASLGIDFGSIRLSVIEVMMEAESATLRRVA